MECRKERCASAHLGPSEVSGEPEGCLFRLGLFYPEERAEPCEEPAQGAEDL